MNSPKNFSLSSSIFKVLLVVFCFLSAVSSAYSAKPLTSQKTAISSLVFPFGKSNQNTFKDGADFLKQVLQAANSLTAYNFQSEMIVFKDGKSINEKSNFYFKQPRQMRGEEIGNYKKGSVIVLKKDGTLRAHMGGIMSKLVITVTPDSHWAQLANDYPFANCDFSSIIQELLNFVKVGKVCLVSNTPITIVGYLKPVYIIELYTDASRQEIMKRVYIDSQTLLPVEWFDYKEGKLFAHTYWRNLKLNLELSDALFQL